MAVTRSSPATWVLPTVNEWYKVSYYVGGGTNAGYWLYPTQSNSTPSNVLSATGTNNANFVTTDSGPPNYGFTDYTNLLTPVGAFAASPGPYGTYDMGGDCPQWLETPFDSLHRGAWGGSWADGYGALAKWVEGGATPTNCGPSLGFRVTYVPEPDTLVMLFAATTGALLVRKLQRFRELMPRNTTPKRGSTPYFFRARFAFSRRQKWFGACRP